MAAPSYDPLGSLIASTHSGLAIAAQIGHNQDRALRLQELRSQDALRRLQEAQISQRMAYEMQAHDLMVQQMADNQKANMRFQTLTTPFFTVQEPVSGPPTADGPGLGTAPVQVPNPAFTPNVGEAYLQSYSGLARTPDAQGKVLLNAASLQLKQAQTIDELRQAATRGQPRFRTLEQTEADKALTHQRESAAKLNESKLTQGNPQATGAMERNVKFLDAQLANGQITKEQYAHAKEIALNLAPKVSAASEWMNRIEVSGLLKRREMLLEKQILEEEKLTAMEAKGVGGFTGVSKTAFEEQKRKAASWKLRVQDVDKEINSYRPSDKHTMTPNTVPPPAGGGDNVIIKTPKGEILTIPRANLPEAIKHGATEYEG